MAARQSHSTNTAHLTDALGVKTTTAIKGLIDEDSVAHTAALAALEATLLARLDGRMAALAAKIDVAGIADDRIRLFVESGLAGLKKKVKEAIKDEVGDKPITSNVAKAAAAAADSALCDCEALIERLKVVEAELGLKAGKSERLKTIEDNATTIADIFGIKHGKSQFVEDVKTGFETLTGVLGFDPKTGRSTRLDDIDARLGKAIGAVNANARASALAFQQANNLWRSSWLWALVGLLATLIGYSIATRTSGWGWDNLPISLVMAAVISGIVAWIIGAFVGTGPSGFVSVSTAASAGTTPSGQPTSAASAASLVDDLFGTSAQANARVN